MDCRVLLASRQPTQPMRTLLILLLFPVWAISARAEYWRSEKHAVFMIVPDAPEWSPFPSSDPLALVSRARVDRTAMFVLTAKPLPAGSPQQLTEDVAKLLRQERADLTETAPMEKITVDGASGYRFSATMSPGGKLLHLDMIFWIYNGHIFGFNLTSTSPVKETPELNALVKSVRFLKK